MDDAFYARQCRGHLQPVLDFAAQARAAGCHVEITNLVIPGLNDSDDAFHRLGEWINTTLGPATPLHLSGYRPTYKMDVQPTPPDTLQHAYDLCRAALPYVYLGNVRTPDGQDTACPGCGETLVERSGYRTRIIGIDNKACAHCGRSVDIVMD